MDRYSMYSTQPSLQRFNPAEPTPPPKDVRGSLRPDGVYGTAMSGSPEQLAQSFFEIVKRGDIAEIQNFLGNLIESCSAE